MWRAALVLFLFGAVFGSALDAIHTHSGTTAYTHEIGLKMAWWTPLVFGVAGLLVGLSYPVARRIARSPVAARSTVSRAAGGFAFFAALYLASGYLPASNAVKLAVLAAGALVLGVSTAPTRVAFGLALVTAIVGPSVEVLLVAAGTFRHLQPDVFGIPAWLPALYAAGAFAFGGLGDVMASAVMNDDLSPSSAERSLL
jgi:hypothetical protein